MTEDDRDIQKDRNVAEEAAGGSIAEESARQPQVTRYTIMISGTFLLAVVLLFAFQAYDDMSTCALLVIIAVTCVLALGLSIFFNRTGADWQKLALTCGIITVLTSITFFVLTIFGVSGLTNWGLIRATMTSFHLALILNAFTLVLMTGLFAKVAPVPLKAIAPWLIVFAVIYSAYAVICVPFMAYLKLDLPGEVRSVSYALMIAALPAILIPLAFLSRKCLGPGESWRSAAIPAAIAASMCGLATGTLVVIDAFSEHGPSLHNNAMPVVSGIDKASDVLLGITYLGISVSLLLLLIPFLLGVRGGGLTIIASIAGGAAFLFGIASMVFSALNTVNDRSITGYIYASGVAIPLVFMAWGLSQLGLILLVERKRSMVDELAENREQLSGLWGLVERLIEVWDEAEDVQDALVEGRAPALESYREASAAADEALNDYTGKWIT